MAQGSRTETNDGRFVVHEHHATKLHFDFRLEMGGVLKSWAVPRGPSLDPNDKRLAVAVPDHAVSYIDYEGRISEGKYGAGEVRVWDRGTYEVVGGKDPLAELEEGKLSFRLHGEKLRGDFSMVKMKGRDGQWLLIKGKDRFAEAGYEIQTILPDEKKSMKRSAKKKPSRKRETVRAENHERDEEETKTVSAAAFKAKELSGNLKVKVKGDEVSLTNLDKIYWPDDDYTKGDLIKYYYEISKYILPYLKDRPLILKRYPNGIKAPFFHQHDVNDAPAFIRTDAIAVEEGHDVDYIIGDGLPTLLYVANLGAIEQHPWHSRVEDLYRPDWFVFDLDPGKGVEFETICEVALSVREVLARLDLECYAKTSGSRGIHIYVPIKPEHTYEEVADFAERVATIVANENSEVATVERSLSKRTRAQIYVDHMQNARGKSVVAPYSVRPKPGATVSAPLEWKEIERKRIRIQDFTIKNMLRRVERKGEMFAPVLKKKQSLKRAMKEIESLSEQATASDG